MFEPSTWVISITPFTADGSLDEDGLRTHVQRMVAGGVGVYVGGGGSGEGYTLSASEASRVVSVAAAAGTTGCVRAMGVEPRTAAEMAQYVSMSAAAGAAAVQLYSLDPGHGHRPTEEEVRRYFLDVLSSTETPVVLSTHQSVGYRVAPSLVTELLQRFDHLVGINCTHPDLGYLAALVDAAHGRAEVHVGGPAQALAALALGGQGYLCSEANVAPRLCASVTSCYGVGDMEGCFSAYAQVLRLSSALYGRGGIRATKALLTSLGLPGGTVRPPQLPADLSVDEIARLRQLISADLR